MTRHATRTAIAAIATGLVAFGGLPHAQAVESQPAQAAAQVAPQADERRSECVRERKISGIPVRSLLCVKVVWDESAGTTTTVARFRVINGTKSNRSMQIRMTTRPGKFRPSDIKNHTIAPGGTVTYTEERVNASYVANPGAKSRVVLYSGETNDYTIAGKTLRATP